jgi:hypothetical protein
MGSARKRELSVYPPKSKQGGRVAELTVAEVSRHGFSVAYDGKDRQTDHSIDVEALAPALLAFGKLIREANTEFNQKRATAKVVVVSDFESKCFHINFDVILGIYEQVKHFVGSDNVTTAKDILDWLGFLKGPAAGVAVPALSYLGFLKWKKGRKVAETKTLTDTDKTGIIEVHVEGEGNSVHVHQHVYNLSQNPKALRATRDAFLPLGQDGFDAVQLKEGDELIRELDLPDIEAIVASCTVGIEEAKEIEPEVETTSAWLSVYSPVFDAKADNWRFKLGTEVIYADITDTTIAADAMARGASNVDDAYMVKLQITTPIDPQGKRKDPQYKILEELRFVGAPPRTQQGTLFEG